MAGGDLTNLVQLFGVAAHAQVEPGIVGLDGQLGVLQVQQVGGLDAGAGPGGAVVLDHGIGGGILSNQRGPLGQAGGLVHHPGIALDAVVPVQEAFLGVGVVQDLQAELHGLFVSGLGDAAGDGADAGAAEDGVQGAVVSGGIGDANPGRAVAVGFHGLVPVVQLAHGGHGDAGTAGEHLGLDGGVVHGQQVGVDQAFLVQAGEPGQPRTIFIGGLAQGHLAVVHGEHVGGVHVAVGTEGAAQAHLPEAGVEGGGEHSAVVLLVEDADHVLKLGDGLGDFQTALLQPVLADHGALVGVVPAAVLTEEAEGIVAAIVGLHGLVIGGVALQESIVGGSVLLDVGGQIPDDLVIQILLGAAHEVGFHDVGQGGGVGHQGVGEGRAVRAGGGQHPLDVHTHLLGQVDVEGAVMPVGKIGVDVVGILRVPGDGLVRIQGIGVGAGQQLHGEGRAGSQNQAQGQNQGQDLFHDGFLL